MKINLRVLYLYLFSFVGLIIVVIGSVQLVNLGIKSVFFRDADVYDYYGPKMEGQPVIDQAEQTRQQKVMSDRQKQRELSNSVAMILVGAPLYAYHWKIIQKSKED